MAQSSGALPLLRIGSRGSPLALAQARQVRERLAAALGCEAEAIALTVIRTSGDAIQDRSLADAGGKGLFTKEIEEALTAGAIDVAVHSAKDMPTLLPRGLAIAACLSREDPRDAFISRCATTLAELPAGARVGTASMRRQAMVRRLRPDVEPITFRGNVETRIAKLEAGVVDATLLALAGLKRLGRSEAATRILSTDEFLPAVGQGIIAMEIREDDARVAEALSLVNNDSAKAALVCERAFLGALDGSCRSPIAGYAAIEGDRVRFRGMVLRPDGSDALETERSGHATEGAVLGADAGQELRRRAGPDFFHGLPS
jgi:hydroxymethylbilane synthase